jgi:hypothetical protein
MNLRVLPALALFATSLAATSLAAVPSAYAAISDADKATARELAKQGKDAENAKDWATAADKYVRAERLFLAANDAVPPTISLGIARAHAALGKLVSAQEHYSRVIHETLPPNAPQSFTDAIAAANAELPALEPRVPGVVINVKGSDAPVVTIDDAPVSAAALGVRRAADPGAHVIKATGVGVTPISVTVKLAEGATETVNIELKPGPGGLSALPVGPAPLPSGGLGAGPVGPPPPPPYDSAAATRRKIGFVSIFGLGGAGLVIGAVGGGIALSKHNSLVDVCSNGHCPAGSESTNSSAISSYTAAGNASTAGFVIAVVGLAVGIPLVVSAPAQEAPATTSGASFSKTASSAGVRLSPVIGPSFTGLSGSF